MNQFEEIYQHGGWDGKGSGPGSTELFTRKFRHVFQKLLTDLKIGSVLDIGSGDWQWQRFMDWSRVKYTGIEISETAYTQSLPWMRDFFSESHVPKNSTMLNKDAFQIPIWPEADLLLAKDIVHHLSRFKVRQLIERAKLYDRVLWVVDLTDKSLGDFYFPHNWPKQAESLKGETVYSFDLSIEGYEYGPKAAILQSNL